MTTPRVICVVTVARSDFGIYKPILNAIQDSDGLELRLLVTGMHLSDRFGLTVKEIEGDGFPIAARVPMPVEDDDAVGIAKAMGVGTIGCAHAYSAIAPDVIMVLGDRYEMLAATVAAVPFNIPIAHIHGGELTFGAIDDAMRHSITKLSHLHFATTQEYAARIAQLGEEDRRIVVSGAPSLDNLNTIPDILLEDLEAFIGVRLAGSVFLITFHPETRAEMPPEKQISALLHALNDSDATMVFTKPNADTGGLKIIDAIATFCAARDNAVLVDNLGTARYFAMMRRATAMIGNSSSGIIESASFSIPVVNIGDRQKGRLQARNVIDCPIDSDSIRTAIDHAVSPEFRQALAGLENPYGDGTAAGKIVSALQTAPLDQEFVAKTFVDRVMG